MAHDVAAVLAQIDQVISRYEEVISEYHFLTGEGELHISAPSVIASELVAVLAGIIERLAPTGIKYAEQAMHGVSGFPNDRITRLVGVLKGLRSDYEHGRLRTIREMVAAN